MTHRPSLLATLMLAPALLLAACSPDDPDSAPEAPASVEPIEQNDILAAASEAGLTALARAAEAAGLTETLQGEGPYTVFAPTNEAFAVLPAGALDSLMADGNRDDLRDLLTYHVVPGRIESGMLAGPISYGTLQGGELTFARTDDGMTVTDGHGNTVHVITPDVNVSNGVIHVIDRVLEPADTTAVR